MNAHENALGPLLVKYPSYDLFVTEWFRWSLLVGSTAAMAAFGVVGSSVEWLGHNDLALAAGGLAACVALGVVVAFRRRQLLRRFRQVAVHEDGLVVDGRSVAWQDNTSVYLGLQHEDGTLAFDFRLFGDNPVRIGGWHAGGVLSSSDGALIAAGPQVPGRDSLLSLLLVAEERFIMRLAGADEVLAPMLGGQVRLAPNLVEQECDGQRVAFRPASGTLANGILHLDGEGQSVDLARNAVSNWPALVAGAQRWFDLELGPMPDVVLRDVDALTSEPDSAQPRQ